MVAMMASARPQPELLRRQALIDAVFASGACTKPFAPSPEAWFREDGEHAGVWQARRAELLQVCAACPVMAHCRELALRDGDGSPDVDYMVRGGLSSTELAAARKTQARRLEAARGRDDRHITAVSADTADFAGALGSGWDEAA